MPARPAIAGRRRLVRFAIPAAAVGLGLLIAAGVFSPGRGLGADVYASMVEAVKGVRTVHITGWEVERHPEAAGARLPVEMWEWRGDDGRFCRFERRGSLTTWDDGERQYRCHEGDDTLFIAKARPPLMPKLPGFIEHLDSLREKGATVTLLGERAVGGRMLKGFRVDRSGRHRMETWLDAASNLPVAGERSEWEEGRWVQKQEYSVRYDEEVPVAVLTYAPPDAAHTVHDFAIDPRFEEWHLHLRRLAARYQQKPLPERMELVPRETDEEIPAYRMVNLPGLRDYAVEALGRTGPWPFTLKGLVDRWRPAGSLRVPREFQSLELNHDLVINRKAQTTERERTEFVLRHLGLEITEVTEERLVWVARYDGRPLPHWKDVKAPVPNPENRPVRPGMASGSGPASMKDLLDSFTHYQSARMDAKGIIIVDETGLPSEPADGVPDSSVAVSNERPYFGGQASIEIARRWFEEQFGVTFTEATRPMTIYVVGRGEQEQ